MKLGDRIKSYERIFAQSAMRRTPLMIRVDGRAFHTYTKQLNKPFDSGLMEDMIQAATGTAQSMQGFKAGYVQSDEATFCLTDYDTLETQGWFDYDIIKAVSISAATMTAYFNSLRPGRTAVFDSRAFSVPREDVVNAFLWRAKDWERNSLQMYCRAFFSHKQLYGKRRQDMHEMLHGVGKNWATDLSGREKNGTFLINSGGAIKLRDDVMATYDQINAAVGGLFVEPAQPQQPQ